LACACCGGARLSKLGEDITETLEVIPKSWKVIQHVREKFTCRDCEKSGQAPAPLHVLARGWAGPSLLAMILVDKYANHQPLNGQSERFACDGVELSVSTMADHVGACTATLRPLYELIKAHVFAAERIHGDDTTVPVLAKVKTRTGRIWTYVRDDRPFGGDAPPAAVFFYSPDRASIHPEQHLAGYDVPGCRKFSAWLCPCTWTAGAVTSSPADPTPRETSPSPLRASPRCHSSRPASPARW
jgi:transposase